MARIELSNIGGGGTTLSLTTTGTSGASTLAGSVLNIPIYQGQLTLTTTGTSGAATLSGDILNIPQYSGGGTPAGSAGQVQFNSTPAGSFAASANLAWDNANVRLNIGAPSSPSSRLNIKGSGTTNTTTSITCTNSSNASVFSVGDNGFVSVNASGTRPTLLRLNNTTLAESVEMTMSVNNVVRAQFGIVGTTNAYILGAPSPNDFGFRTDDNNILFSMNSGNSVQAILNPAGNFGVGGFTSVSARLHVRGSNASSGTNALLVQNNRSPTPDDIYKIENNGKISYLATNTAAGTTGAQTINRPSGTVNFAAGATSLVVTNSLCTTASIVLPVIRTNDATAQIKNVVPAAGSFTINLSAAATAETSVGFFIIN